MSLEPSIARAFARLEHTESAEVVAWVRETRQQDLERLSRAESEAVMRKLQGRIHFAEEFLALVNDTYSRKLAPANPTHMQGV
jgi:hypothetical protein